MEGAALHLMWWGTCAGSSCFKLLLWALPCPFLNVCWFFPPFRYCSGLLIAAAGKCLFAEAFALFSMSFPRTPLSLGVAEEADFIGMELLLECFFSVNHCSAAVFSMPIQKQKRLNLYICFLVLIPSSGRAWQIYYRWDADKQCLETWLRQPTSL